MGVDGVQSFIKQVGARVQEIRESKGISKTVLADKLGKERSDIREIERGDRNLTLRLLYELADGLKVDPISLLDFDRKLEAAVKKPAKQAKKVPAKKKAAKKTKK